MSDTIETTTDVEPEPEAGITADGDVSGQAQEASAEPETFSREYVTRLRQEAAEARVRARMTDVANEHLLAAYAVADGRLQALDFLPPVADVLGDDGLVNRDKVTDAIGALLTERPYLAQIKAAPLPGGVRTDPTPAIGWVDVLRGGGR